MSNELTPAGYDIVENFCKDEIGSSGTTFFIQFLLNDEADSTSGNAFYLEKRGSMVVIGNLFDEEMGEVEVEKTYFISFLQRYIECVLTEKGKGIT